MISNWIYFTNNMVRILYIYIIVMNIVMSKYCTLLHVGSLLGWKWKILRRWIVHVHILAASFHFKKLSSPQFSKWICEWMNPMNPTSPTKSPWFSMVFWFFHGFPMVFPPVLPTFFPVKTIGSRARSASAWRASRPRWGAGTPSGSPGAAGRWRGRRREAPRRPGGGGG